MAFISIPKPYRWRPRVSPAVPRFSNSSSSFNLLRFFSSTEDSTSISDQAPNPEPEPQHESQPQPEAAVSEEPQLESSDPASSTEENTSTELPRELRQKRERLEDTICRLMVEERWTGRVQKTIRKLVPEFNHALVCSVIHRARSADHALQFFRWMERSGLFQHDETTHKKLFERLRRAYKNNHARCILMDMPKKGLKWDEDMFVSLIESYGHSGVVQESVKIFDKMKELGVERTAKSYDAFFNVIFRWRGFNMAKRYFNRMVSEGVEPSEHTYNIMIGGFFLCDKLKTAIRFYEDMKSRGIEPDVVTYNTMINGYLRFKNMDEAERLFAEMKEKNIEHNVCSYTAMIKGYILVGQIDDALRFYEEMKSLGLKPNAVTYATLLPGLSEAGKTAEVLEVVAEMNMKDIAPKYYSIFKELISCLCKSGDMDAAIGMIKAMMRLKIPVEAGHYGILIENFCKAEAYDQAEWSLDMVIENELILGQESSFEMEDSAYNPMIQYLCSHGKTAKAEFIFRQLMKKGVLDPQCFNNLITGHSKEGNPEAAFEIMKIMKRREVPRGVDTYKSLIESFLFKREPADAKMVLDSMVEDEYLPEASLFRSVMQSLFEAGRFQTASRVMKIMVEKGVTENMDLVVKILEALFVRGHDGEALGRIELLMHSGCAPDFDSLTSSLCERGKRIAALKLLDFCLERDWTVGLSSFEKALDCFFEAGKTLHTYSLLCKMKMKRKTEVSEWSKLDDLIKSLNLEGNTKQADVLSRMYKGKGNETVSESKKGKKTAPVEA